MDLVNAYSITTLSGDVYLENLFAKREDAEVISHGYGWSILAEVCVSK